MIFAINLLTEVFVGRDTSTGVLVSDDVGLAMYDEEKRETLSSLSSDGNCTRHFPSRTQVDRALH